MTEFCEQNWRASVISEHQVENAAYPAAMAFDVSLVYQYQPNLVILSGAKDLLFLRPSALSELIT
jgi:hypothetical protein